MEKERTVDDILIKIMKLSHIRMHKCMGEQEIYPGQPKLLQALFICDGISQKELAKNSFITPATATIMLRKLEEEGFIKREVDKNDQRMIRIFLTEKGRDLAKQAHKIKQQLLKDTFRNFTKEETETLRKLLIKVEQNLL